MQTHGVNKKIPPQGAEKKIGAFGAITLPPKLKLEKYGLENFGGSGGGKGLEFEQAAPVLCT